MTRSQRSSRVMRLAWSLFRDGSGRSHSEAMKLAHGKVSEIQSGILRSNPDVQAVLAKSQNLVKQVRAKHDLGCGCGNCPTREWQAVDLSLFPPGKIKLGSIYRRADKARAGDIQAIGFTKREGAAYNRMMTAKACYVPKEMRHRLFPDMARLAPVYKGFTAERQYQV